MRLDSQWPGVAARLSEALAAPRRAVLFLTMLAFLLPAAPAVRAQAAQHYLGSITAVSGDTLTVKTDAGDVHQVQVPASAQLRQIEPGQTDLSKAQPLDYAGLAVGDRVLVTLAANASGGTPQAARIIAIKKSDVAKMQESENAAWNRGVHGLVKSVDASTGAIVVTTRTGVSTRDVVVQVAAATTLKRYAPGSIDFGLAQPAPLSAIQPGDQLSARGTKNADGSSLAADAVVSGSFHSIPGTVVSADTAASTLTVKDLAAKKTVTVRIGADAQLRRLDDNIATMLAARLKGNPGGGASGPGGAVPRGSSQSGGPGQSEGPRGFSPGGAGAGRMDIETVLERAPQIQLGALKKGDAVMIVATEDATGLSVVKLLAGVEPLLEAPEAQDLLSNWSLNSGESEAAQ